VSRPPHARRRIVEGARQLVRTRGAAALTLNALASSSGVSRSAVLYHWPSRRALIQGLVEEDLQAWERHCRESVIGGDAFAARIQASLDPRDGVGTLAACLLEEARNDPSTWDLVLRLDRDRFRDWHWDDADVARYVLLLATEGAFWRRLHGLSPQVPDIEGRVQARIARWFRELPSGACRAPTPIRTHASA